MLSLRQPSAAHLARLAAAAETSELTYPELGATARPLPGGYQHGRWETDLGPYDEARFGRLADAMERWQIQLSAGLAVWPAGPVRPGLTFALALPLPAGWALAAGRVVYVTSEPGRRGFAYGTLPRHPECGEEAFHLVRAGGRLRLEIVSFSRPQHPLARLGAPAARALQRRANEAYLTGMQAYARALRP